MSDVAPNVEYDAGNQSPSAGSDRGRIDDLIERSSLGTPEAKALRASVSDERAAAIVKRAEELSERCACGHDAGDHAPNGACRFWCHTSAEWDGKTPCTRVIPPARPAQ